MPAPDCYMAQPVRIYLSVCRYCLKSNYTEGSGDYLRAMCLICVTVFPVADTRSHECSRNAGSIGFMCVDCSGVNPMDEDGDYAPSLQCEQCKELSANVQDILVHECQVAPIWQVNVPVVMNAATT